MARYVWALVHGVAMLGIAGQLRDPVGVEELMRYAFERLRTGIPLDGHRTLPADAVILNAGRSDKDGVVRLTIREGRNRQVRRMLEAVGHPVQTLKRTRIGPISDRQLKPGAWRELTEEEVRRLTRLAERDE